MYHNLRVASRYLFFILFLLNIKNVTGQFPDLGFQPAISSGLSQPVDIVNAGDGSNRIFIAQQGGTIRTYDQSLTYLGDFLTVTGLNTSGGERGLLSLAFHPNYTANGYLYVYYTGGVNGDVTIARYTRSSTDTTKADPNSRVILLSIPKPVDGGGVPFSNHNGGKLNFGPEGYLYFGPGDGGSGNDPYNNAQDLSTYRGKMLRIDVSNPNSPYYFIPADNPFVSNPNALHEIWAFGLRNPWRWSFDKQTHDMWIGDVGQGAREEVDFRAAGTTGGVNYGWRCYEGFIPTPGIPACSPSNYVAPIYDYAHDTAGGIAIIGGYVYRGSEFPSLLGYYIFGDYTSQNAWLIKPDGSGGWNVNRQRKLPASIMSFGEAENGTLYVAGGDNIIYKVLATAQAPLAVQLLSFTVRQQTGYNEISWKTANEINLKEFIPEFSSNAVAFNETERIRAGTNTNGSSYSYRHSIPGSNLTYYRLKMINKDNGYTYSRIISTQVKSSIEPVKIYNSITNGRVQIELNVPFNSLRVINMYGQIMYDENPGNRTGIFDLNSSMWKKGMYILILVSNQMRITKKIVVQ